MMRVALLTYSTKPRGGVVHTLALAEALVRAGSEVDVWTLGRGGDEGFFRVVDPRVGVRVVPFPSRDGEDVGERIVRSIAVLAEAFRGAGERYDIVHAQDCITANAVPRCIRTVHHLDAFTTPQLVACHDRAIAEPVAVVCVSASVAGEVRAGWGRIATVIPNGVDAARFAAAVHDSAGRQRWAGRLGRYVVAVGGIEPRKGSRDLLEAFALLRVDHPDVALVFAGGETLFDYRDYRAGFDARAAELDVSPLMLGVVDDHALPSLVAQAAALPFVSTHEGFGLAAMEALAAGVPVVARDLPVLREVFDGAVAFAVDPPSIAAQLDAVIRSGAPAARRAAGRALAAAHSWDRAAAAHLELYATLPFGAGG